MSFNRVANSNRLQVGTLVLIKENNSPPLQWSLGRIITVHPGKDGIATLVVTLKTKGKKTLSPSYRRLEIA